MSNNNKSLLNNIKPKAPAAPNTVTQTIIDEAAAPVSVTKTKTTLVKRVHKADDAVVTYTVGLDIYDSFKAIAKARGIKLRTLLERALLTYLDAREEDADGAEEIFFSSNAAKVHRYTNVTVAVRERLEAFADQYDLKYSAIIEHVIIDTVRKEQGSIQRSLF